MPGWERGRPRPPAQRAPVPAHCPKAATPCGAVSPMPPRGGCARSETGHPLSAGRPHPFPTPSRGKATTHLAVAKATATSAPVGFQMQVEPPREGSRCTAAANAHRSAGFSNGPANLGSDLTFSRRSGADSALSPGQPCAVRDVRPQKTISISPIIPFSMRGTMRHGKKAAIAA